VYDKTHAHVAAAENDVLCAATIPGVVHCTGSASGHDRISKDRCKLCVLRQLGPGSGVPNQQSLGAGEQETKQWWELTEWQLGRQ